MENKKTFYFGKLLTKVGAGILIYLWLNDKFARKGDVVETGDGRVLTITDENKADYLVSHPDDNYTNILTIPNDIDIVIFETTKAISVHNIMPRTGDFANGKDLRVGGNFAPYMPSGVKEEYQFSEHIYSDISRNNGGVTMYEKDCNLIDLTCWRKIWWFNV